MDKISTAQAPSPIEIDSEIGVAVINPKDYLKAINDWLILHKLNPLSINQLTRYAVLAYDEDDLIAIAMLTRMEGNRCAIEGAIVNPRVGKKRRNAALDKGLMMLEEAAYSMGYKQIESFLDRKTLETRFINHGYSKVRELTMYSKDLSNGRFI